jgi:hypothetical protein
MVDKSENFSWLVRLGYAARGMLYLVIGYLALATSGHDKSQRGAMAYVRDTLPGGVVLLYLTAAGLLAYAIYKECSLLFDAEHHGTTAKNLAVRAAHGGTGLIYAALAWSAFRLAQGHHQASGAGVREATHTAFSLGVGPLALGLAGIGFFVGAGAQVNQAVRARFMRHISRQAPAPVEYFGRGGFAARAMVFAVVGWSLVRGAWFHHGPEVKSLGDAIDALAAQHVLYQLVAVGVVLFGLLSLVEARYRIIPDLDAGDLKPRLR